MLQRKTMGKVSLRHVEEGDQGAGVDCVCVCVYTVECKFWNIPDSTFMCMDRTVCKSRYSLCNPWTVLNPVVVTFILPI